MLTARSLLQVWEASAGLAPASRAVALAALAFPEAGVEKLSALPLGVRDAGLFRLRRGIFGDTISCLTHCPECKSELELSLPIARILEAGEIETGCYRTVQLGAYHVRFRSPDSTDLLAISEFHLEQDEAQKRLLARCVAQVEGPNGSTDSTELPQGVIDLLADEMERHDPLSVVWLDLGCGQCGVRWRSVLDIASLLWIEVDRWAEALLREVHQIARAYGWAENDVLAMSSVRRQRYLGMIGS